MSKWASLNGSPSRRRLDLLQLHKTFAFILIKIAAHKIEASLILQIHNGFDQRRMLVAQFQPQFAAGSQMATGQVEDQTRHTQTIRAAIQCIQVLIAAGDKTTYEISDQNKCIIADINRLCLSQALVSLRLITYPILFRATFSPKNFHMYETHFKYLRQSDKDKNSMNNFSLINKSWIWFCNQ